MRPHVLTIGRTVQGMPTALANWQAHFHRWQHQTVQHERRSGRIWSVRLIGAGVLPGKISVIKGVPRLRDAPAGAPLMVIFRGERMPGASRTARSALRACGHRGGVPARYRPAAGAGMLTGGGAAPGGLPPVGRGFPAAPGSASCPPIRPAPGHSSLASVTLPAR